MKRQRPLFTEDAPPRGATQILNQIKAAKFDCETLAMLAQQISSLRALEMNHIINLVPSEVWLAIFRRATRTVGVFCWLPNRTVCKLWASTIFCLKILKVGSPNLDISAWENPSKKQVGYLNLDRLLPKFPSLTTLVISDSLLLSSSTLAQLSELRKVTIFYDASGLAARVPWDLVSKLQVLKLEAHPRIKSSMLDQLTGLKKLTLECVDIMKIPPLPHLTSLQIISPHCLTPGEFTQRKNLRLISDDPKLFNNRKGVLVTKNGQVKYDGDWFGGKMHGKGTYYIDDGDKYVGDFVDGSPQGQGTLYSKNGEVYQGAWFKGMKQGKGVLKCPSGERIEGYWIAGSLDHQGFQKIFEDCF